MFEHLSLLAPFTFSLNVLVARYAYILCAAHDFVIEWVPCEIVMAVLHGAHVYFLLLKLFMTGLACIEFLCYFFYFQIMKSGVHTVSSIDFAKLAIDFPFLFYTLFFKVNLFPDGNDGWNCLYNLDLNHIPFILCCHWFQVPTLNFGLNHLLFIHYSLNYNLSYILSLLKID